MGGCRWSVGGGWWSSAQEGAEEAAKVKINCLQREKAKRATASETSAHSWTLPHTFTCFSLAVKCNQHKLYASARQEGCTQLTRKHIFQRGRQAKAAWRKNW